MFNHIAITLGWFVQHATLIGFFSTYSLVGALARRAGLTP